MENEQYWTSIWILLNNFHAVNRKIFACLVNDVYRIEAPGENVIQSDPTASKLLKSSRTELGDALCVSIPQSGGFKVQQRLLLKKEKTNINANLTIDFCKKSYTCNFEDGNFDDFILELKDGDICCKALTQRNERESSDRWLEFVLKPKVLKWAQSDKDGTDFKSCIKSLQLIDMEKYNEMYKSFKLKYADQLKKCWLQAHESTDPLKFIYEDLAIASYLICLWNSEHAKKPTAFADLGCGNGLLVYVLNQEGYPGYGYDIRRRRLWSIYSPDIQSKLIETTIVPNRFSPPNDVDWLIGNHSDELSPWIPVLTALSNYKMCFFLLPCCAFEFSGANFQRRNAKLSSYQDFYIYARELSSKAGFQTLEDRLKIPSTKRLALVGYKRNYTAAEYESERKKLKEFVTKEMKQFPHSAGKDVDIKLREKCEAVRNCTKIDKEVIDDLVLRIFKLLLEAPPAPNSKEDIRWREGGPLTMREIAQCLSKQDLLHIKSQCGGIKTLLRNKHEVFQFLEDDAICLRKPAKRCKPDTVKKRRCYFDEHHPDGCPLPDVDCTFIHSISGGNKVKQDEGYT